LLILNRQPGDRIHVGDNVVITLVEVRSNGVARIGVDAPKSVAVHRHEVYEAIQRELLKRRPGLNLDAEAARDNFDGA
jgi:carbon storage regulator